MQNHSSIGYGTIFVVATPIGNLDDISKRAIDTLNSVDFILAEDTRHSKYLLKHLNIRKPLHSLHAHNEQQKSEQFIARVLGGESLALISDAGTPLISDPGYPLIQLAQQKGIKVSPIPGSCALIAALSAAGIPCQKFSFIGFLPHKTEQKKTVLAESAKFEHTIAFYESPHRLEDTIHCIHAIYGPDFQFVLAKELTKTFETISLGTSHDHLNWLSEDSAHKKGEFVILLPPTHQTKQDDSEFILRILLEDLPVKQATHLCAKITNKSKNDLYKLALTLKK